MNALCVVTLATTPALSSVRCWATVSRCRFCGPRSLKGYAGIVVVGVAPHEARQVEDGLGLIVCVQVGAMLKVRIFER